MRKGTRKQCEFKDAARCDMIGALAESPASETSHGKAGGLGGFSQKINFPSRFPGEVPSVLGSKTKLE